MEKDLIVLAAGMGSRYGGLKQLEQVGPGGETLLEYSVYDAIHAGFERVVFIVRESFREVFEDRLVTPLRGKIETLCVCQELDKVPAGAEERIEGRKKPWGTAHAVWCAREFIRDRLCGVINADDFYGRPGLHTLSQGLDGSAEALVVGYPLQSTLSANGTVSRGILATHEDGSLAAIRETHKIAKSGDGSVRGLAADGTEVVLQPQTLVSMNCVGFGPSLLHSLELEVEGFFSAGAEGECYLPDVFSRFAATGNRIQVSRTDSPWLGITYAEDAAEVRKRLRKMMLSGDYPERLWD